MAPSQKTMLFVCLLVAAEAVVVPVAQGGLIHPLVGSLYAIQDTIYCTVNAKKATIGTPGGVVVSPPFANATVQLHCGAGNGTVVASVITNSLGKLLLFDGSLKTFLQLISGCRVVVATPLASCNATLLSTGTLTSNLTPGVKSTIAGIHVTKLSLKGFTLRV